MTESDIEVLVAEAKKTKLELEKLKLMNDNLTIITEFDKNPLGIQFHSNNLRISVVNQELAELEPNAKKPPEDPPPTPPPV